MIGEDYQLFWSYELAYISICTHFCRLSIKFRGFNPTESRAYNVETFNSSAPFVGGGGGGGVLSVLLLTALLARVIKPRATFSSPH